MKDVNLEYRMLVPETRKTFRRWIAAHLGSAIVAGVMRTPKGRSAPIIDVTIGDYSTYIEHLKASNDNGLEKISLSLLHKTDEVKAGRQSHWDTLCDWMIHLGEKECYVVFEGDETCNANYLFTNDDLSDLADEVWSGGECITFGIETTKEIDAETVA